jgi:hypothetical protein
MPPQLLWSRKVVIAEDEEPDWLQAASTEIFGDAPPPSERLVTVEHHRVGKHGRGQARRDFESQQQQQQQQQQQRHVFVARSQPQSHKRKHDAEHEYQRRVRHSPEKTKFPDRAPLANGTNGQLGAPRRDLDSLISQHAKGFSTLIRKGLRGEPKKKRSKAKQAAIALAAQRLEEQLGSSFTAVAASRGGGGEEMIVQPWRQQQAGPQRLIYRQKY